MNWSDIKWKFRESRIWRWWYWHIEYPYIYPFRKFFNPCHKIVRRAIPCCWVDSDHLIVHINFAIITEFVDQELSGQAELIKLIDFHTKNKNDEFYNPTWLEFYQWLIGAYNYFTI